MINANKARRMSNNFYELKEKCEEKIKERAEHGATSAVIMGYEDIASEKAVEKMVDNLKKNGYEVYIEGVNLHIKW